MKLITEHTNEVEYIVEGKNKKHPCRKKDHAGWKESCW